MAHFEFIEGGISQSVWNEGSGKGNLLKGATAIFKGTVRADNIENKTVVGIEFTAHKEIASETVSNIAHGLMQKHDLYRIDIYHSFGFVKVGEDCFVVIVESKHRKNSFKALPEIVNEFKELVPVFGKELYEDGSYEWKKNKG